MRTGHRLTTQNKNDFHVSCLHTEVPCFGTQVLVPSGMAEDETIVYDLLTEVLHTKGASDTTYARAVAKFGEAGVIDLLGVAGYYGLLAMVMNVARTAVPEGKPLPLPPLPIMAKPQ